MLFPTLFWTQKLWSHLLDKLGKSQCASLQWSPPGQSYIGTPFIIINIALKTEVETTPIRVVTINRRATSLVAALRVWKMVKYTAIRQSRVIRPFQTLSQYVYSPSCVHILVPINRMSNRINYISILKVCIKVIKRLTVSSMKMSEVQFMKASDLLVQSIKPNANYESPVA